MSEMIEYDVTIKATVTKTIRVSVPKDVPEDDREERAEELAHQEFDATSNGQAEHYEENVISTKIIEQTT